MCAVLLIQKQALPQQHTGNKMLLRRSITKRCIGHHPPRYYWHQLSSLFGTLTFSDVPGLLLEHDFLSPDQHNKVFSEVRRTSAMAQEMACLSDSPPARVSPAHNIPIRSEYIPVKLPLEGQLDNGPSLSSTTKSTRSAEHFCNYGQGHRLTYYRGNENIPRLGLPLNFLDRLLALKGIDQEVQKSRCQRLVGRSRTAVVEEEEDLKHKWRLTLNHYPSSSVTNGGGRVGFPWHCDLEANGAATVILGLGSPGRLEFGKKSSSNNNNLGEDLSSVPSSSPNDNLVERRAEDVVEPVRSITLKPGSLLILTGPARWHFVHRVLPSVNGGERASLVYGIW